MPNRTRAIDEALRAWQRHRLALGDQLRTARKLLGATQAQVGAAIGVSGSEVCRRELGRRANVQTESLVAHAAAVGLRVAINLFPVGGGVRDAAQLRYLARFLERVADTFVRELEAVIPIAGDLRAIDAILRSPGCVIAVEVITRLGDVQAQLRAARLKARDGSATRLVIVVASTHANRRALEEARATLAASFDLDTRRVMADLAAGRQPARDALVLV